MRLLLFSDLHCDASAARRLVDRARQADVVVGAGDFATARRGLHVTLDVLAAIDHPAVLVPGNSESVDELAEACRDWDQAHVLHGTGTLVHDVPFFGIGGGIPVTPFGSWSYDFTEDEAEELLAECPEGGVLVSHSPPKGVVDVSSRGLSLGSVAVREVVERRRPKLVVCGHIHDSAGQHARFRETMVVNAGPGGLEWLLDDSSNGPA